MSFYRQWLWRWQNALLLVNLFYENKGNSAAALWKFRLIKNLRKGPLLPQALKRIIVRFVITGDLRVQPGRGHVNRLVQISLKMLLLLLLNNQWTMLQAVTVHVQYHRTWVFPPVWWRTYWGKWCIFSHAKIVTISSFCLATWRSNWSLYWHF